MASRMCNTRVFVLAMASLACFWSLLPSANGETIQFVTEFRVNTDGPVDALWRQNLVALMQSFLPDLHAANVTFVLGEAR